MPKGMKPSPNFKGNKNSGRHSDAVIIAKAIDLGLANSVGNEELKRIKEQRTDERNEFDLKEIVMPVILKGMANKTDLTSGGKEFPILGGITNDSNNSSSKNTKSK